MKSTKKALLIAMSLATLTFGSLGLMSCSQKKGPDEEQTHQHTFADYVSNDDATCEDDGTKTATCECGETDTIADVGSALGHNFKDGICDSCGAEDPDYDPYTEGLEFTLINNDTEYEVTGYTGESENVIIPANYEGKPVTSIFSASSNSKSPFYAKRFVIKSIKLGKNLKSIGKYAFYSCGGLTELVIPNGVTTIGNSAFASCSKLSSITIPDSVTTLGDIAFEYCSGLKYVTLGKNVSAIGEYTFRGCSALREIAIPDSVTKIGQMAFSGCVVMNKVTFGTGVTQIGSSAFSGCSAVKEFILPDGLLTIGNSAFNECGFEKLSLGKSLTSIGSNAFSSMNLKQVIIPATVTQIGQDAFNYCSWVNIYCEATEKPSGWNANWNSNKPTYWFSETQSEGCWHYVDGVPTQW